MTRNQHRCLACIVGAGMVGLTVLLMARGVAADKAPPKAMLPADASKFGVEAPTEKMLADRTAPSTASPASEFVNPKVEPGKVQWHKTFENACRSAQKTGRPVLLFQMMGKLDERFC